MKFYFHFLYTTLGNQRIVRWLSAFPPSKLVASFFSNLIFYLHCSGAVCCRGQCPQHVILVEKYNNGTAKRSLFNISLHYLAFFLSIRVHLWVQISIEHHGFHMVWKLYVKVYLLDKVVWLSGLWVFLFNCGSASRFILDDDIQIQTFLEEGGSKTERVQGSSFSDMQLSWLPIIVKDFILPAGFPGDELWFIYLFSILIFSKLIVWNVFVNHLLLAHYGIYLFYTCYECIKKHL